MHEPAVSDLKVTAFREGVVLVALARDESPPMEMRIPWRLVPQLGQALIQAARDFEAYQQEWVARMLDAIEEP